MNHVTLRLNARGFSTTLSAHSAHLLHLFQDNKLTSDATFPFLRKAIQEGQLVRRGPLQPTLRRVRQLYMTPEVAALIDGKVEGKGFPCAEARVVTDRFIVGHLMVASLTEDTEPRNARPDMERLEGLDEAWVMCLRVPKPGWRLMGRFAAQGHFVILTAHDRHELKGKNVYESHANDMIAIWKRKFPGEEPLRKATPLDYIGWVVRDVTK